jgi:cobalt-zinc-cadmium efflux system outer membrane protein
MIRVNWLKRVFWATCVFLIPLFGYAESSKWNAWLTTQIQQHPDIIAARKQLFSNNANAEAAEQPLYNPEISTEVERNGSDNNFLVGVQQTIDWWDRQEFKQQQANYLRAEAEAIYQQQVLDKTTQALNALIEWHFASRVSTITKTQQQQLNTLLELAQKRQRAGDLGSVDAELTFLSLSQQLAQVAEVDVALQKAQFRVRELLPEWSPERGNIPADFWSTSLDAVSDQELLKHPTVASAHANWQSLKEETNVVQRATKAEPTIGINVGRDSDEDVVALSFSIPLNVRNNFSAETRAAESRALEAEAQFQAAFRKQRFDSQAAYNTWQTYAQQYQRWQTVAQSRVENSAKLLERQWRSGDLSTSNYLLALNQRAESLLAGIELGKQTQHALTEVLQQSGRLNIMTIPATSVTNQ